VREKKHYSIIQVGDNIPRFYNMGSAPEAKFRFHKDLPIISPHASYE
jgi:hypothetical protein